MNDPDLMDMTIVLDLGHLEVEVIAEVNGRTAMMMMIGMRGLKGGETERRSVNVVIMMWYALYSNPEYIIWLG